MFLKIESVISNGTFDLPNENFGFVRFIEIWLYADAYADLL